MSKEEPFTLENLQRRGETGHQQKREKELKNGLDRRMGDPEKGSCGMRELKST